MTAPPTGASRGLPDLLGDLEWRGLVHATSAGLAERLATGRPISAYNGFDPTAASLHVGHLVPLFGLVRLQRHGVKPYALVGGATGMVGDPSGRSAERVLLDRATVDANAAAIRDQMARFLDFDDGPVQAVMANNLDWLGSVGLLDFLRDIGKHFTIPYMLSKDSVQVRLERGLSYTEFSYMLLQSYDFAHLFRTMGVELQMGGADQWGNITAGLELIRRVEGRGEIAADSSDAGAAEPTAFGLCSPLLLTRSGQKMGKSEKGAVFLDAALTSHFDFYQYWINDDDALVLDHLRWLTTLEASTIEGIAAEQAARPEGRHAQQALAFDLTARIHGAEEAQRQVALAEAAFAAVVDDPEVLASLHQALGGFEFGPEAEAWTVLDLAVAAGGASRAEARRLITQGGLSVNGERLADPTAAPPALIAGRYWWVSLGKKRRVVGRRSG